jgi:hypothetical protein
MEESQQGYDEKDIAFIKEVATIINKHSMENRSNTPDYILAEYLLGCLTVYENTVVSRDGRKDIVHNACGKNVEDCSCKDARVKVIS